MIHLVFVSAGRVLIPTSPLHLSISSSLTASILSTKYIYQRTSRCSPCTSSHSIRQVWLFEAQGPIEKMGKLSSGSQVFFIYACVFFKSILVHFFLHRLLTVYLVPTCTTTFLAGFEKTKHHNQRIC